MPTPDFDLLAMQHIAFACGNPDSVLTSFEEELEKIAGPMWRAGLEAGAERLWGGAKSVVPETLTRARQALGAKALKARKALPEAAEQVMQPRALAAPGAAAERMAPVAQNAAQPRALKAPPASSERMMQSAGVDVAPARAAAPPTRQAVTLADPPTNLKVAPLPSAHPSRTIVPERAASPTIVPERAASPTIVPRTPISVRKAGAPLNASPAPAPINHSATPPAVSASPAVAAVDAPGTPLTAGPPPIAPAPAGDWRQQVNDGAQKARNWYGGLSESQRQAIMVGGGGLAIGAAGGALLSR